jgi:hypothetical protein
MKVSALTLLICAALCLAFPSAPALADDGEPTAFDHCTWVPAAARTFGYGDAFYASDLYLTNAGDDAAQVSVAFLARDEDNSIAPIAMLDPVDAGRSIVIEDVVGSLLEGQWQDWVGGLAVCSDAANLNVFSRTYHTDGVATFGQGIPGARIGAAIGDGRTGLLMGLREDAAFRTNLGLLNPTGSNLTVAVTIIDLGGQTIAVLDIELEPYEQIQYHKILTQVGEEELERAVAMVSSTSGPVFAYLSVIDNSTNDPTYVAPVILEETPSS